MSSLATKDHDFQKSLLPNPNNFFTELLSTLPKQNRVGTLRDLYKYQGFWYSSIILTGVTQAQKQFQALPTDIIIAGGPKTGNTWLKALCFAIATRKRYQDDHDHQIENHPLLSNLPHSLVPFLEVDFLKDTPTITNTREHTLLSTHMPYTSLPESIPSCGCKIIYICREPKDTFVSQWHFAKRLDELRSARSGSEMKLDSSLIYHDEFNLFCEGKTSWGPYWDHVLGYYKASLDKPDMFLFLKYEELKADTVFYVRKMAEFMCEPFSNEEEHEGMPEKIVRMCSFQSLSGLEVNKTGKFRPIGHVELDNCAYFRQGNTGDWKYHLTPEMAERIDTIKEEKLRGSGFSFGLDT
ncbi:hypothetical protein RD792_006166 [Penstemon davidsonii]|uniref:Sulfotransferase n=1 Tax=Penstemon davidsonii TaxID=160366 RepID=A0ABR0DC83_9LAMI|nr:hypothetical protein RD792_006166 [Penstemon davidsonii]